MIPVLLTNTSPAPQPARSAASAAISSASATPRDPVAQFALPEFTTAARSEPPAARSRLTSTGAAQDWFCVNIAADAQGASETSIAKSGSPDSLIPAVNPPARNPLAAVIAPAPSPFGIAPSAPTGRCRCWTARPSQAARTSG